MTLEEDDALDMRDVAIFHPSYSEVLYTTRPEEETLWIFGPTIFR